MNPLRRFERLATTLFEERLPQWFGGRLDPSQISLQIDRTLSAHAGESQPPEALEIRLNPDDFAHCVKKLAEIELHLTNYLAVRVPERWPDSSRRVLVQIVPLAEVPEHSVCIVAGRTASARATTVIRSVHVDRTPPPVTLWLGADRLPISALPLAIGRALDNDIVLEGPETSRYHAQIRASGRGLSVVDLSSRNGTFVNGARVVGEVRLHDGDELAIGRHRLRMGSGGKHIR